MPELPINANQTNMTPASHQEKCTALQLWKSSSASPVARATWVVAADQGARFPRPDAPAPTTSTPPPNQVAAPSPFQITPLPTALNRPSRPPLPLSCLLRDSSPLSDPQQLEHPLPRVHIHMRIPPALNLLLVIPLHRGHELILHVLGIRPIAVSCEPRLLIQPIQAPRPGRRAAAATGLGSSAGRVEDDAPAQQQAAS